MDWALCTVLNCSWRKRWTPRGKYPDASILVVADEATRAVDGDAKVAGAGSGRWYIAHRLRSVVGFGRVFVVGAGRVIEIGGLGELYDAGGWFRGLCEESRVGEGILRLRKGCGGRGEGALNCSLMEDTL